MEGNDWPKEANNPRHLPVYFARSDREQIAAETAFRFVSRASSRSRVLSASGKMSVRSLEKCTRRRVFFPTVNFPAFPRITHLFVADFLVISPWSRFLPRRAIFIATLSISFSPCLVIIRLAVVLLNFPIRSLTSSRLILSSRCSVMPFRRHAFAANLSAHFSPSIFNANCDIMFYRW